MPPPGSLRELLLSTSQWLAELRLKTVAPPITKLLCSSAHRELYVGQASGVPTRAFAEDIGADYEEFEDIFWRSITVTSEELEKTSTKIKEVMIPGAEIHLTGPNGTDIPLHSF